ncbi:hypothetical protein F5876DRAFT_70185 [Lentinula aff. lateritia]|uniref:Uncharacterized protein n=1 Tax=Lentinula aff. lateritia TaxID=2804960 RepID=A0ACC1TJN7_9AGAR|nr:hypothetical protein F5876DRAFT_70185 [Lentinula aff. lateritia]
MAIRMLRMKESQGCTSAQIVQSVRDGSGRTYALKRSRPFMSIARKSGPQRSSAIWHCNPSRTGVATPPHGHSIIGSEAIRALHSRVRAQTGLLWQDNIIVIKDFYKFITEIVGEVYRGQRGTGEEESEETEWEEKGKVARGMGGGTKSVEKVGGRGQEEAEGGRFTEAEEEERDTWDNIVVAFRGKGEFESVAADARYETNTGKGYMYSSVKVGCTFENPIPKIYDTLPLPKEEIEEVLAVMFSGSTKPTQDDYACALLLVRRNVVAKGLQILILNHFDYNDVVFSSANLESYAEDTPIVTVEYFQKGSNRNAEGISVHDDLNDDGTEEGNCVFTVHGIVGPSIKNMTRNQMIGIAVMHLDNESKFMWTSHAENPESLWNNPQLYPKMFPWLFPFWSWRYWYFRN